MYQILCVNGLQGISHFTHTTGPDCASTPNLAYSNLTNHGLEWLSKSLRLTRSTLAKLELSPRYLTRMHDQTTYSVTLCHHYYHKNISLTLKDHNKDPQQSRGKSRLIVEKQTPSHSSSQIWNTYQGKKDMPLWFLPKIENRNEQIIVHMRSQSRCPYPAIIQNMASCSCSSLCMSLKSKH